MVHMLCLFSLTNVIYSQRWSQRLGHVCCQLTATVPPGANSSRSFCKLTLASISMTTSTPRPPVASCIKDKRVCDWRGFWHPHPLKYILSERASVWFNQLNSTHTILSVSSLRGFSTYWGNCKHCLVLKRKYLNNASTVRVVHSCLRVLYVSSWEYFIFDSLQSDTRWGHRDVISSVRNFKWLSKFM